MYAKNTDKKVIPVLLKGAQMKGWFLFKFGRIDCIDSANALQMDKLLQNLSDWTGKNRVEPSAQPSVKRTHDSKPTYPAYDQTKASPAANVDLISKIRNTLEAFKIKVLSITADVRSTGVRYKIVPTSGIRAAAIQNIHRELALALGIGKVTVVEHLDGTVTLTIEDRPAEKLWRVGDYYNVDGKEGIVFLVDESRKHGKIVSLHEARLQWCTDDESKKKLTSIAVHRQNGMINLQSIMEITDWKSKYPAFAWCADRGTGWYLPAKEELEILFADKNVYAQVNKGLELKGKMLEPLGRGTAYWSSTEKNSHSAFGYSLNNYCADGVCREKSYYVRAVAAF